MRLGRLEITWHRKVDPYCMRPGHKCATPGEGPCNGLPRLSDVYANPRLLGTERKADYEDDTCDYGRDCTMTWTPHISQLCAPRSHDDCPPEGCPCPATMPAEIREALDDDPRVHDAWEYPPCKAKFRSEHGCLVACTRKLGHYRDDRDTPEYSWHQGLCACDAAYHWAESQALYPGEEHVTPGDRCDGCA